MDGLSERSERKPRDELAVGGVLDPPLQLGLIEIC